MTVYIYAIMSIIQYQLYRNFHNAMCMSVEDNEGYKSNILNTGKKTKNTGNIEYVVNMIFVAAAIIMIMLLVYSVSVYNVWNIKQMAMIAACVICMYASGSRKKVVWYKSFASAVLYVVILITSVIVTGRLADWTGIYINNSSVSVSRYLYPCVVFVDSIIVLLYDMYNNGRKTELGKTACYALILTSIIQLMSVIYIDNIYTEIHSSAGCVLFLVTDCIASNMLMILITQLDTQIRHSYEEDVLKIEIENNTKLYDNIIEAREELKDIRHDLKNRLNSLSYSITLEDYEAARKELNGILDNINKAGKPDYCDNLKVNSIFVYKLSGVPEWVDVKCIIDVPGVMDIDYGDMNVIIGNLMDNSINAVKRVKDREKAYIDINLTCSAGNLIFIIKNRYNNEIEMRDSDYYLNHGRGISSVKKILRKYNGSYESQKSLDEYETCIMATMYNVSDK